MERKNTSLDDRIKERYKLNAKDFIPFYGGFNYAFRVSKGPEETSLSSPMAVRAAFKKTAILGAYNAACLLPLIYGLQQIVEKLS